MYSLLSPEEKSAFLRTVNRCAAETAKQLEPIKEQNFALVVRWIARHTAHDNPEIHIEVAAKKPVDSDNSVLVAVKAYAAITGASSRVETVRSESFRSLEECRKDWFKAALAEASREELMRRLWRKHRRAYPHHYAEDVNTGNRL